MLKEIQEKCAKQFEEELEKSFNKTLGVSAKTLHNKIEQLEQENQQLKEKIEGIQEERDYLFNKLSFENQQLKDELEWYKQQCDDLEMQIGCQE